MRQERVPGEAMSVWGSNDELMFIVVWGHLPFETAKILAWVHAKREWGASDAGVYSWAEAEVEWAYGDFLKEEESFWDLSWQERAFIRENDANSITDGNVTDGNITDGNITDGNITDGNTTEGGTETPESLTSKEDLALLSSSACDGTTSKDRLILPPCTKVIPT